MSLVEIAAGMFITIVVLNAIGQRGIEIIGQIFLWALGLLLSYVILTIGVGQDKAVEFIGAFCLMALFLALLELAKTLSNQRWAICLYNKLIGPSNNRGYQDINPWTPAGNGYLRLKTRQELTAELNAARAERRHPTRQSSPQPSAHRSPAD